MASDSLKSHPPASDRISLFGNWVPTADMATIKLFGSECKQNKKRHDTNCPIARRGADGCFHHIPSFSKHDFCASANVAKSSPVSNEGYVRWSHMQFADCRL
jgi:hypothetical protein